MKVTVRGFGNGRLLFEKTVDDDVDDVAALAWSHVERVAAYRAHMIELEFWEEANPLERFIRFGTDRTGMVLPVPVRWE